VQQTVQATWRRVGRSRRRVAAVLLTASALISSACSPGGPEALPGQDSLQPEGPARPGDLPEPPNASAASDALTVTREQRAYLDDLAAAGVSSTSDLRALTIGSSVCQARAAQQSDQAVWDFIVPLVRSDVRAVRPPSTAITRGEVDTVTAEYIRVATDRLCY
jgi:hypothetical protein